MNTYENKNVHLPELLTEKETSVEFTKALGEKNLQSSCCESEQEFFTFFAIFVEFYLAVTGYWNNVVSALREITWGINVEITQNGLRWEYLKNSGTDIIGLYCLIKNLPRKSAVFELAQKCGLCMDNLKVTPYIKENSTLALHRLDKRPDYYPLHITIGNSCFTYQNQILVHAISGEIEYKLYQYTFQNKVRLFPGQRVWLIDEKSFGNYRNFDVFQIGKNPAEARLINRHKIHLNSDAIILWHMDFLVADSLNKKFEESSLVESRKIIVTGCTGSCAEFEDCTDLYARIVVLMLPLSRHGMVEAVKVVNNCYKNGASRVYISTSFVTNYKVSLENLSIDAMGDPFEREILKNITSLENLESASQLCSKIIENAIPIEDFIRWGKELGVFKDEQLLDMGFAQKGFQHTVHPIHIQSIATPSNEMETGNKNSIRMYPINTVMPSKSSALLWGETNCGKSLFSLHMCACFAFGWQMAFFENLKSRIVLILDGESDSQILHNRITPLHGKRYINQSDMNNLRILFNKEMQSDDKVKLLCSDYQDKLLKFIMSSGITVLCIDNLMSLCPTVFRSTKDFDIFINFIQKLQSNGVSVILVHHSNKTGDSMKGLYDLEALAQNVFSLKKINNCSKATSQNQGLHVSFTATKCKLAVELENEQKELYLPMNGYEWQDMSAKSFGSSLGNTGISGDELSALEPSETQSVNLTPDENKLLEYFRQNQQPMSRANIENVLKCQEDKARNMAKSLISKGFLDKHGGGPNTYYILRK